MAVFFRLFSSFPLSWLHFLGHIVGWVIYWSSPSYRAHLHANLQQAGLNSVQLRRRAIVAAGQSIMELPYIWLRSTPTTTAHIEIKNWELVEQAMNQQQGVLFLLPHLGCFELMGHVIAHHFPLTALYRPHRKAAFAPWVEQGRLRHQIKLASTNLRGVRKLITAIKKGEAAVILPDQVPSKGDGIWASFFGKPAYTMTLPARIVESLHPQVVLSYCERLTNNPRYAYRLWFLPFPAEISNDVPTLTQSINHAIEDVIRRCPEQYLWSYNRYKSPPNHPHKE